MCLKVRFFSVILLYNKIGLMPMDMQRKNDSASVRKHLTSFPRLNPNPVIELDRSGRVTFANLAAKKSLRKSGSGTNLDFFIPSDINTILEKFKKDKNRQFTREITIGKIIFLESINSVPEFGTIRIYAIDVTKRVNAEKELKTINRELEERVQQRTKELTIHNRTISMLSACNMTLVRANKKEKLLRDICNIIIKTGGYKMAWIGIPQQDSRKSVLPIMQVGFEKGYLEKADISWSEKTLRGRGPTGRAIRERKMQIGRYLSPDPALAPWREDAIKRNFASSIALPLIMKDKLFGALTIYSENPAAFDEKEVHLLKELADDLDYGIFSLEMRQEHEKSRKFLLATNKCRKVYQGHEQVQPYRHPHTQPGRVHSLWRPPRLQL